MSFRPVQLLFALATVWPCAGATAAEAKPVLLDGLAVTFKPQNGAQADTTVRPHFMLYVPLGQAPTPFVAPGVFTAEWEGVIQLDLRDRFVFQAELNGSFKLELNGAVVLEATHPAQLPQQHAEGDLHFAARRRCVFSALLGHA